MSVIGLSISTFFSLLSVALFLAAAAGVWATGSYSVAGVISTWYIRLLYVQQQSLGFDVIVSNDWLGSPATWNYFRAAAASLYIAFIFSLLAAIASGLQLCGCLPAYGSRVVVLYGTVLAFAWGLIGTAIGGSRTYTDVVDVIPTPANAINPGGKFLVWGYAFACAVAATVVMFVNIFFALCAGSTAHHKEILPPTPRSLSSASPATGAPPVAIQMRSLE